MAGNIQDRSTFGWVSVDTDGQSVSPAYQFESERSLGFYRSAASTVALIYLLGLVVLLFAPETKGRRLPD